MKAIIYTSNKTGRTPEEDDMLDMMVNGGKRVALQNLKVNGGMIILIYLLHMKKTERQFAERQRIIGQD